MTTPVLEPCPNPACPRTKGPTVAHADAFAKGRQVVCWSCAMAGPFAATEEAAVDRWNALARRPSPADLAQSEREALAAAAAYKGPSVGCGAGAPADQRTAREVVREFVNGFWGMVEKVPDRRGERLVERLAAMLEADRASRPAAPEETPK